MACNCGKAKNRGAYVIRLKGGLKITKYSKSEADAFVAQHNGSEIISKPA